MSKRAWKVTLTQLQALRIDSAARQSSQQLILFGRKLVEEHLQRGGVVLQLYATPQCQLKGLVSSSTVVQLVEHADLQRVNGVESTPADGCAAVVPLPATSSPGSAIFGAGSRTLVLDRMSDPGNVGALFRSARAFDFASVVLLGGCDPFNEKVLRASMGTALQLRLWRCEEDEFVRVWREAAASAASPPSMVVCDASANGSVPLASWRCTPTSAAPAAGALCLILGNEAHGVRPTLRQLADTRLHIPMNAEVESLNAAVAGSILMHHVHAQRRS